jgi:hypothetical protein
MENPLCRSKSYFTGQNFAKFRPKQREKTLLDYGLVIYIKINLKAKEDFFWVLWLIYGWQGFIILRQKKNYENSNIFHHTKI